ncbi:Uncharacterised protein [Legionella beliardensis]|uniref:Transmembrane protein n=1 Tax=Legionella beliardensis TaxID=91822 RepID=A0A378I4A6_9GAMM|nr:hypothetical protein [Legionella beliardensis]STX30018.1 Uncharacterised protein [Legionella beliardensis]
MNNRLNYFFQTLIPFLIIGIAIAMLVGLLIMFSYILVWGILIGGILWLASIVKNFLFPKRVISKTDGRIIEHNEKK